MDTVLARVYFEFDKYELKDSSISTLKKNIEILSHQEYDQLEVCGYTDAVGSEMYNQILSVKRAQAVSNFLVDHGIAVDHMIVKGFGEKQLLVLEEEESVTNRRVELILKRKVTAKEYSSINGI